tara:strand:+ start:2710 stop:3663 length:954 start_codon:yes stop_codon:yes gene_type:complete
MTAPILPADNPEAIAKAADILRDGGLVAMPTETVYGLAADAANGKAVARLYEAKGRPRFNPLIAHVASVDMAQSCVVFDEAARQLAEHFWPGPMTLVLPRRAGAPISDLAGAGLDTLAVRRPAHPAAQALLDTFGSPLVAPSANPSGGVSPTTAAHVAEGLGDRIDLILDGGACKVGLESTVITFADGAATLLRPGGLARRDIEAITGKLRLAAPDGPVASPGMLASHYAPRAKLRLNAQFVRPGEAFLGFGNTPRATLNLSRKGDLVEAAANLFAHLRTLDRTGAACIAVSPIPVEGLGEAINDRLQRAAAPRGLA